jgi:hypothetical protein
VQGDMGWCEDCQEWHDLDEVQRALIEDARIRESDDDADEKPEGDTETNDIDDLIDDLI